MKIKRQKPRREGRPRMSASGGFAGEKAKILYPQFNPINYEYRLILLLRVSYLLKSFLNLSENCGIVDR
jgi:hypothetical protein